MELLLIRHARPFHLVDESGADPDLTDEGWVQAKRLAQSVGGGRYGSVHAIVSSPMRRARQTAEPLREVLGHDVVIDDRLAELDRGWKEYGITLDAYPRRRDLVLDLNAGRMGANTFDPEEFRARVVGGIEGVIAGSAIAGSAAQSRVAVVCHGGVINAYLSHVLGLARLVFVQPHYTSVTRVLAEPDGYREILSVNEFDHLHVSTGTA